MPVFALPYFEISSLPQDGHSIGTSTIYLNPHLLFDVILPCLPDGFKSFVTSPDEISRLFAAADDVAKDTQSRQFARVEFPLILRLLYGCGLRLNEALHLRIADLDLQVGVLLIRNAKGNKDRIVPMDSSLTGIMQAFMYSQRKDALPDSFLFPNRKGRPYSDAIARMWFNLTLEKAGIEKPSLPRYSRNICLHCIRHTFAVTSFRKQDRAGVDMYAAAPYLSTYMGHEKIYGSEKYLHMTAENSEDVLEQTTSYSAGLFPEVPR